jgi:hypothetical protein
MAFEVAWVCTFGIDNKRVIAPEFIQPPTFFFTSFNCWNSGLAE